MLWGKIGQIRVTSKEMVKILSQNLQEGQGRIEPHNYFRKKAI